MKSNSVDVPIALILDKMNSEYILEKHFNIRTINNLHIFELVLILYSDQNNLGHIINYI